MAASHEYRAQLTWRRGGEGISAGNHRIEWPGRPGVDLSAAPQYKGDPTRTNPEELFVALAMVDRKMRMASVVLRPRITVAAGSDLGKARTLVETAHENCFIASSVSCPVSVEPEIVAAG
jgi:organic hydroperoxide reductase OsmC/OhrA